MSEPLFYVLLPIIPVVIVILLCLLSWFCKKRTHSDHKNLEGPDASRIAIITEYLSVVSPDDENKVYGIFSKSEMKSLNSGHFSMVYQANLHATEKNEVRKIAIKWLKDEYYYHNDGLLEAKTMKNLRHRNIVALEGFVKDTNGKVQMIAMELLDYTLKDYVTRPEWLEPGTDRPNRWPKLINVAMQLLEACKFVEKHHYVHRDIRAANILMKKLDSAELLVKLGDFGLARQVTKLFGSHYDIYVSKVGKIPRNWLPSRCAKPGCNFSSETDVWMFGVVMWEMLTDGDQPERSETTEPPYELPLDCPQELVDLMLYCWNEDEERRQNYRITFENLSTSKEWNRCMDLWLTRNLLYYQENEL